MKATIEILFVFIRNQFIVLPIAVYRISFLRKRIKDSGFNDASVKIWLGLAPVQNIGLSVIFQFDEDIKYFLAKNGEMSILNELKSSFRDSHFLNSAADKVTIRYCSWEQIRKAGGYYKYFK